MGLYNPDELTDVDAIQFSMHLRMFSNQVMRVKSHYELGLASQEDYEFALQQLATFMNTPGGILFRETSPGYDERFSELLEPYMDSAPVVELMLGRNKDNLR